MYEIYSGKICDSFWRTNHAMSSFLELSKVGAVSNIIIFSVNMVSTWQWTGSNVLYLARDWRSGTFLLFWSVSLSMWMYHKLKGSSLRSCGLFSEVVMPKSPSSFSVKHWALCWSSVLSSVLALLQSVATFPLTSAEPEFHPLFLQFLKGISREGRQESMAFCWWNEPGFMEWLSSWWESAPFKMVSEGRAWSWVTWWWGSVQEGEWLEEDRTEVAVAYSEHKVLDVDYRNKVRCHQTENSRKNIMV